MNGDIHKRFPLWKIIFVYAYLCSFCIKVASDNGYLEQYWYSRWPRKILLVKNAGKALLTPSFACMIA